jgi:hypothetical protein
MTIGDALFILAAGGTLATMLGFLLGQVEIKINIDWRKKE